MNKFGIIWKNYLKNKYNIDTKIPEDWIPPDERERLLKTEARYCYEFFEYLQKEQMKIEV